MRGSVYRRRDRDSVRWCAHVKWTDAGGEKRQRKKSYRTEREAERALTDMLRQLDLGLAVPVDQVTVDAQIIGWLDHLAHVVGRKPSTVDSYRRLLRRYVSPELGAMRMQHVSAADVDRVYRGLAERGLSARTIRYVHSVLRKLFGDAERQGTVPTNVVLRATPPSTVAAKAPTFPTWTWEDLARFLDHVDGHAHAEAIAFAALTGVRRGEVVGLRWADVDLAAHTATIAQSVVVVDGKYIAGPTKTHRARPIGLDDHLVELLRRHRTEQTAWRLQVGPFWVGRDLVFPGPDGDYLKPETLTQQFGRLVAAAGVPRIRFHDLRHTHGTLLVESGKDAKIVSERLGHSTVAFTLDRYVHPSVDQQIAAANDFARRLRRPS